MNTKGPINRRSFLRAVAGTAALGGSTAMVSGCATLANSDSDPFDPVGQGYGRQNGYPDNYEECTDADRGRNSDPRGRGRRCQGRQQQQYQQNCSDSDSGQYADPSGRGRRCQTQQRSCSDSDSGEYADPSGRGRRC